MARSFNDKLRDYENRLERERSEREEEREREGEPYGPDYEDEYRELKIRVGRGRWEF